jgi:myo-inositol-1(or 4)-monophosphatase
LTQSNAQLAQLAVDIVLDSLNSLVASNIGNQQIFHENEKDIKLNADLMLSRELSIRLSKATGICCLSEEEIETHQLFAKDVVWIVDPLDGSMNFFKGIPLYCISIALWRKGNPVVGVIHDIARNRTFVSAGNQSRVDNQIMHVGNIVKINKAVLATGFPLLSDLSSASVNWFLAFAEEFKKVRMLGTAALSLAWVAEGRLDAYFERDIMVWDVAAGAALVKGAGGICIMRQGRHPMSLDVMAANPELAECMKKILKW